MENLNNDITPQIISAMENYAKTCCHHALQNAYVSLAISIDLPETEEYDIAHKVILREENIVLL